MIEAVLFSFSFGFGSLLLAWHYFRHYSVKRPPIGVFNLWDVAAILFATLVIPYVYLWLPLWAVGGFLGLITLGICYFTLDSVISSRLRLWMISLTLVVSDILILFLFGATSKLFFSINNLLQLVGIVGIANLWAQGGIKARDCAILGGVLIAYDIIFVAGLPLMNSLFERLKGLPLAPLVGWPVNDEEWLAIGLGDLLLNAVFPLVIRKAFGRTAGRIALFIAIAALILVFMLPTLNLMRATFPVMILLGPLMVAQYLFWRQRLGIERTTRQYLEDEPLSDIEHLSTDAQALVSEQPATDANEHARI